MNAFPPCVGERLRDTACDMANITHLSRFRDAKAADERAAVEREDRVMRALVPIAQLRNATVEQVESAKAAALTQLTAKRSPAFALSRALKHLPKPARS